MLIDQLGRVISWSNKIFHTYNYFISDDMVIKIIL